MGISYRKFISLALGVIQDCYTESREDAVLSFMQELPNWGNFSCFAIVFASSRMQDIIVHGCYQDSLNYLWTGEILTETPMWKVAKNFNFLFYLYYTLIDVEVEIIL